MWSYGQRLDTSDDNMKDTLKNKPTLEFELSLKKQGYKYIIGVDEAGRGPLAGPVVAAAVYIPDGFNVEGINDSKKLSSKKRELFYNKIVTECEYSVAFVDERVIDAINIREATKLAMQRAINYFNDKADFAIVDGNFIPDMISIPARPIIDGDAQSFSIAAASIVAKFTRDAHMEALDYIYPIYGFAKHKGYGTKDHLEAIRTYGPSYAHRKTFGGVKEYV